VRRKYDTQPHIAYNGHMENELYDQLSPEEKAFHDALVSVTDKYGKFDDNGGVWVGYVSAAENNDNPPGIKCGNCAFYEGNGVCHIVARSVEEGGLCRLAAIPDSLATTKFWNGAFVK